MDNLERTIIELKARVEFERERTDWYIADLNRRLLRQEERPASTGHMLTLGGLLKIMLAVCLPLLVLLATGDIRQALAAVRLLSG